MRQRIRHYSRNLKLFRHQFHDDQAFKTVLKELGVKEEIQDKVDELEIEILGGKAFCFDKEKLKRDYQNLLYWKAIEEEGKE